jgi:uncharacterized alpha/beta hydrolase family protein
VVAAVLRGCTEQIAMALESAEKIVLVGHSTGESSAVEYLLDYLKKYHPR